MKTYYTRDHEWVRIEGGSGTVGITAYAAGQLGDITFVDLPAPGRKVTRGDVLCEVESVKAASEVFAPVSGMVLEANQNLVAAPEIINASPEGEGWIAKLAPGAPGEEAELMTEADYREYLDSLK